MLTLNPTTFDDLDRIKQRFMGWGFPSEKSAAWGWSWFPPPGSQDVGWVDISEDWKTAWERAYAPVYWVLVSRQTTPPQKGENMVKKLTIPLTLALVAALGLSGLAINGVAFAASSAATRLRFTGTILSVFPTAQRFMIEETNTSAQIIFRVAEGTVYKGLAGSISELKPAMKVVVIAVQGQNGAYRAISVNVVRLKFKGDINGTVTALGAKSFTLQGIDGVAYTFRVTKGTKFTGQGVSSFAGLKVGMSIRVDFTDLKTGVLRAVSVTVHPIS